MFITQKNLKEFDPELWASINNETTRQEEHIELIASENYTSYAVQMAMANWLTDKYAEGIPYRRFYAGCELQNKLTFRILLKVRFPNHRVLCLKAQSPY